MKKMIIDDELDQITSHEFNERVKDIIQEKGNKGHQIALISQNWNVAYDMLSELLDRGVNVRNILLRDEQGFDHSHVHSYDSPKHMGGAMGSLYTSGIEYFIAMALDHLIPASIVKGYNEILWNLHASVLPEYMGVGNPVLKQLKNGNEFGGVTLQYVGKRQDEGEVLVRCKKKLVYDNETEPIANPPKILIRKNYESVIFPTAAEVCAFVLKHINKIKPTQMEDLNSAEALTPNRMIYARK
jgi:folate-dependent phosphoribosylglycinamide formyltransferase PurN